MKVTVGVGVKVAVGAGVAVGSGVAVGTSVAVGTGVSVGAAVGVEAAGEEDGITPLSASEPQETNDAVSIIIITVSIKDLLFIVESPDTSFAVPCKFKILSSIFSENKCKGQ